MTIELTGDEALVLFERLARVCPGDGATMEHAAESRVLWDLEAELERRLAEPFDPEYLTVLGQARGRVATGTGGGAR